jgi:hypothetical protein
MEASLFRQVTLVVMIVPSNRLKKRRAFDAFRSDTATVPMRCAFLLNSPLTLRPFFPRQPSIVCGDLMRADTATPGRSPSKADSPSKAAHRASNQELRVFAPRTATDPRGKVSGGTRATRVATVSIGHLCRMQ